MDAVRKYDEYFMHLYKFFIHCWETRPEEVIVNGKKKRMFKGRMKIEHHPFVITDWQNTLRFVPWLQGFYDGVIMKRDVEAIHADGLELEAMDYSTKIRKILKAEF
jgi:hypothetical protein